MRMRERMLAVVRGEEADRVPFAQYTGLGAPDEEIWREIGRDNMGIIVWTSIHHVARPNCRWVEEDIVRDGLRGKHTTLQTPRGSLTSVRLFEPALNTGSIREHFVKEPEDYEVLLAFLRDGNVVENKGAVEEAWRRAGEDGLAVVVLDRTPFQQLWVEWVNIEDLCLHLVDGPDRVQACMDEMIRIHRQAFEIAARTPMEMINFPDNITAPIIGERYFREYCVPLYRELADMLADRGVPVCVHMDGDLKPLWAAIGESGVRALDSLTPPPDNDTSAADAVRLWPEMRVFLNFPSSVHLAPPEKIYAAAMEILEQAGHSGRLAIQISENVPPGGWRKSYPEIVRAILDFGKP